jgi:hypothetical protein
MDSRPPWERTGSTPRERLTELATLCVEKRRNVFTSVEGDRLKSTGGATYMVPVADVLALLADLEAAEARECWCCIDNVCECVNPDDTDTPEGET